MKFKSPWKLTVKGLSRQQLICISPFTSRQQQLSHIFTSSEWLNTTPTRRLLEPFHHDSRQSVQEGLASCFVSDRCSWPTVRHASSCTKAPLCAINHVKPAWSYKSLLWGNPPIQIYKMVRGAMFPPKCCRNALIDRYQQMRRDLICCLVSGSHVKFYGRMWMLILAVCV